MKTVSFSQDGSTMICSSSKAVVIFSTADMTKQGQFEANGYINKMLLTQEGKIVVATNKSTLTIFTQEGEQEQEIKLKEEPITLDVSPDGAFAYVGCSVTLTNLNSNREERSTR